jgi:predicted TIM-barrel fold metal-dependent hydrolase
MDKTKITKAVLSLGPPGVDRADSIQESVRLAKMVNDKIARVCGEYDGRFAGLATLPLTDVKSSVEELGRSVRELSLKGAMIFSNVSGKYLDSPEFFPLYEKAQALEVPLYIHPTLPYGLESMVQYGLYVTVGYLFDSSLSVMRMIHAGLLDKFPSLKLVLSQLGGVLPYIVNRIDVQWRILGLKEGSKINSPPSGYLKKMYLDTVSNYASAYRCALDLVSYERILFGSDFPFGDMQRSKTAVESLGLPEDETRSVLADASSKLFRIS